MLNIKEIALKVADSLRNKIDGISHMQSNQGLVAFAEALISAYKAELLKEVGEPIAYYDPDLGCGSASISFDPLSDGIYLYTSNQVAAVILKVTKPLKEEVARYRGKSIANAERTEAYLYENQELRAQLAAEQLNNKRLREALKMVTNKVCWSVFTDSEEMQIEEALAQPSDTSALDAYVAEKVKEAGKFDIWKTNPYTKVLETSIKQLTRQRDLAIDALKSCGVNDGLNGPTQYFDEELVGRAIKGSIE